MEAFISQPLMATPIDATDPASSGGGFAFVPQQSVPAPTPQAPVAPAPQAPPQPPAPQPPAPIVADLPAPRGGRFGASEFKRYMSLAVLVSIGLAIHWAGAFYVEEWVQDLDGLQQTLARVGYPAALALLFWHMRSSLV